MKILFLTTWYPRKESPFDGVFVREHARAASIYDNEVVVVHNQGPDKSVRRFYEFSDKKEDGLRVIRIRYRPSLIPKTSYLNYIWSTIRTFMWLLKDGGFRPDVIHAHVFPAGAMAVLLGRIYKIPVVLTEHYTGIPRNRLVWIEEIEFNFAMKRANMILPVSESLKNAIIERRIKNRIEVIPNPVDIKGASLDRAKGSDSGRKKMLFVGFLTPRKAIPYLLEAVAALKKKRSDFELDIVGDGPEREKCERIADDLGIRDIVRFHGSASDDIKNEFLKTCSFFVLPSLHETFGVVLIEAMAFGKPVVATSSEAVKELVNHKTGVLIPPKDISALQAAIGHMLDHSHDYSPEEISEYVKNRFSHEIIGKRLDSIYKDLAGARKRNVI